MCLGHQCIAAAFGGDVIRAPELRHGKTSMIRHNDNGIFARLVNPFEAVRYHSLIADASTLPAVLEITAQTDDGLIMGVKHRTAPIHGVQFHPESVLPTLASSCWKTFWTSPRLNDRGRGVPA